MKINRPVKRALVWSRHFESLEGRTLLSASPVTISVVNNGSEAGPTNGEFRVTRTESNRDAALTVTLRVGGTATYGSDYTLPTSPADHKITFTIPAHELSKLLPVTVIDDSSPETTETVEVTAVTSAGTTYDPGASAHLSITDNDSELDTTPPTARANGSYRVTEGRTETLHGSATVAVGRSITLYEWDFDYDGSTFHTDATGASAKFSAAGLDGTKLGVTRTLALRVTDSAGVVSTISTTTIRIVNAPPTAHLIGGSVKIGNDGVVKFTDINDVPADVAAGFTFRFDFNNDGVIDLATHRSSVVVPASYLNAVGAHTIRASIRDKDDGVSTYTATVVVSGTTERTQAAVYSQVAIGEPDLLQGDLAGRLADLIV